MKLQAQSARVLSSALGNSLKCIASKNAVAILDYVLLSKHDDGVLYFTSATSDSQLTVPAPFTVVEGKFEKPVALPVKNITQFLSTLPDCTITFDFVDDKILSLEYCTTVGDKTKTGKVSLTYIQGNEFPMMVSPSDGGCHISLPGSVFVGVVDKVKNFAAIDELRPVMGAMCIDVSEDMSEVVFVATDSHVLYKRVHSNDSSKGGSDFFRGGTPSKILLHKQYFRTLSVFSSAEQIDIESDGHVIRVTSGDIEFICKALDGRYPNYNSVIPRNNPYHVCFDKSEMLAVIKRVAMFSSESDNLVELRKDGLFLTVSAEDIDFGQSADDQVLITDAECPDGFRIGFKASSLIDVISSVGADSIRLTLADPSRPGVVTADEPSPRVLALVMPMILNN